MVPKKKNVVIVLDTSGSMSSSVNGINSSVAAPTRSMVAQEAAMTVLKTLGTSDHVRNGRSFKKIKQVGHKCLSIKLFELFLKNILKLLHVNSQMLL